MKVLVLWPPHVPSYFNAGHHISTFLTAGHLRTLDAVDSVRAIDAGALNYTWKELGDLLFQERFDVIAVINDFDNVDDLPRLLKYVRTLSPGTKVVTAGRLSAQSPLSFREFDLDAVVVGGGDPEAGVAAYVRHLAEPSGPPPAGVALRGQDPAQAPAGLFLRPDAWVLPDVTEIPYEAYERLYQRDQNKFCGIPQRRELVVPAARGCPVNCSFCEVPTFQGLKDRRLTVERTLGYIEESFARHPFEYVAFYAPTFTLDRKWTAHLCRELIARGSKYPWKCATTIAHLGDELLDLMARSGCVRVSVGVETLDPAGHDALPRLKRLEQERYERLAASCARLGVELNCFVIVGLPGTTVAGTAHTAHTIRAAQGRVRPTVYSSMDRLRAAASPEEAAAFNRQLLHPDDVPDAETAQSLYGLVYGREDWVTPVTERVPQRGTDAVPERSTESLERAR
ncbi:B12-binding domain-containing radical SAM protein [Streptomyces monticola]|uniref:B12-binding domain-containing radical SAM protein n=1 Tax=Streptomyces monticola TaxID=2666263 RepID=A0ABW2JEP4_9ACTN